MGTAGKMNRECRRSLHNNNKKNKKSENVKIVEAHYSSSGGAKPFSEVEENDVRSQPHQRKWRDQKGLKYRNPQHQHAVEDH